MAKSKLLVKDNFVECSICTGEFIEPKELPCLHSFCLECLEIYCIDEEEGNPMSCPLCPNVFYIPIGGVKELPDNNFLRRLVFVKDVNEKKTGKETLKCDPCRKLGEHADALAYCLECKQTLCLRCRELHNVITTLRLHNIISMDWRTDDEKAQTHYCPSHPSKPIERFCSDCNSFLCCDCNFYKHDGHRCKQLHEFAEEKKELLHSYEGKMQKCHDASCGQVLHNQQQTAKLADDTSVAMELLEDVCDKIQQLIISSKNKLRDKLLMNKAIGQTEMEPREYEDQMLNAKLTSYLEYSRMLMERGTDCEIIRVADELHKRAEELIKLQDERNKQETPEYLVKFIASAAPTTESIEKLIGQVLVKDESQIPMTHRMQNSIKSIQAGGEIKGVTVLNDQICIVSCKQAQLLIFMYDSYTGATKKKLTNANLKDVQDLAGCLHNNALYISCGEPECIHRVNLYNDSVESWRLTNNHQPLGLSITPEHHLLVCVKVNEPAENNKIMEYTTEGLMMSAICLDKSIDKAWQAVKLPGGQFIVCHGGFFSSLYRLVRLDFRAEIIMSYGKDGGKGEGQLNWPRSISLNTDRSHAFVADQWNDRVLIFSKNLILVGKVDTPEDLSKPWRLHYDSSSDRLFIGEQTTGRLLIISKPEQCVKEN